MTNKTSGMEERVARSLFNKTEDIRIKQLIGIDPDSWIAERLTWESSTNKEFMLEMARAALDEIGKTQIK